MAVQDFEMEYGEQIQKELEAEIEKYVADQT